MIACALWCGRSLDVGAERMKAGSNRRARQGPRIVLDPELRSVLIGETGEDEVAPRAAAAWLAHCLVEEGGGRLQVADGEDGLLIIGASLPA